MNPFLEKLAGELFNKYGEDISKICVVFPSRRAGIFFKEYLSRKLSKPIWSPNVYSIQDFIAMLSPAPVSDKVTLIFKLYEVFNKYIEEPFSKFYLWGEILLNDFDEIDKNLVQADYLFRIIREHKDVEQDFELKVSDIETFYKFWATFSNRELNATDEEFHQVWKILAKVYHGFRQSLQEKKICYEGMAYRRIYEMLRSKELTLEWNKVIFAGFNLLNKAEDGIINELLKQGKGEIYWDADKYYTSSDIQEAGQSLRENFVKFKVDKPSWIENNLLKGKKNIKIIGAPLQIAQAKALGNELKNINAPTADNTAVVLPDEAMLFPVLHSIPDNIGSYNVTMGFPMKETPMFSLLRLLKSLQKNKKGNGKSLVYYHKDVIQALLHPYIKFTAPGDIYRLINKIKQKNIIYISVKRIAESFTEMPEIVSAVFSESETAGETMEYVYDVITILSKNAEESKGSKFESEYLYRFYTELNHLHDIIKNHTIELDSNMVWDLLVEVVSSLRIPFTGEPLRGMQIMGLLETRQLDFKNVYILSMNEGILPRTSRHGSFIPYSLRKAFKLPTYEDEDAISAYYFYRLIQKAENVTLIYNTEPGEILAGEKSRFIMQIENELASENKNITLEHAIFQTDINIQRPIEITIPKSEEILEKLRNEKYFSATALTRYINCPLQFYLRTVAKLKEEEEVEEFFSGGGFGTIFHQIMSMIYGDYINTFVDAKVIKSLIGDLNKNYDKMWEDACSEIPQYEEFRTGVKGKNLLYKNIIKRLIEKILANDIKEAPFKIISLETQAEVVIELSVEGRTEKIKFHGRLDRVEEKDGAVRIIDYKTGIITTSWYNKKITPDNIELVFTDIVQKEKFQQYFYAGVFLANYPVDKIKVGIYPLRKMSEGIMFFGDEFISKEILELFNGKLKELMVKIFDSKTPFTQTKEIERCRYCDYKSICYRD